MSARPQRPGPFDRRTAAWLVVLSAVSLGVALLYAALGPELRADASDGADAFSLSAIGHHALVAALGEAGVEVVVSRHASADKASRGAPLVLAEPRLLHAGASGESGVPLALGLRALVRAALERGADVVVVLPKWQGRADPKHAGWIARAELGPVDAAAEVLALASESPKRASDIVRAAGPLAGFASSLRTRDGTPIGSDARTTPALPRPQLVGQSPWLEPLVWASEGVLLARVRSEAERGAPGAAASTAAPGRLFVLSDPDLINNAGLGRGGNAPAVEAFVRDVLHAETLVVDETLHGHGRPPSLWADLLRWPLVLVTAHFGLVLALLLWTTTARFGRPEPLPPRIASGAAAIVASTAELLATSAAPDTLPRYLALRLRRAATACGVPAGLPDAAVAARLVAIGRARGTSDTPEGLGAAVATLGSDRGGRALVVARRIHRYCEELTHGHG